MSSKPIRFAVAGDGESHSTVWRLWANRSELYLAGRSHTGILKISFHKNGKNRAAKVLTTPRPALISWERRPEFCPGWTFCFGIVVPPPVTNFPFRETIKDDKPILIVPPPTQEQKAVFQLLLSSNEANEKDLRALNHPKEIKVLGRILMPHEQAWLTLFYDGYNTNDRSIVQEYFEKLTIQLGHSSEIKGIKAAYLHFIEASGANPHLIDIQLGRENVRIEGQC